MGYSKKVTDLLYKIAQHSGRWEKEKKYVGQLIDMINKDPSVIPIEERTNGYPMSNCFILSLLNEDEEMVERLLQIGFVFQIKNEHCIAFLMNNFDIALIWERYNHPDGYFDKITDDKTREKYLDNVPDEDREKVAEKLGWVTVAN